MRAVDTSVVVAALLTWHRSHQTARSAFRDAVAPAHVVTESYSVLTRLPQPLSRTDASTLLGKAFPSDRILVPSDQLQRSLVKRCSELGIEGGAIYDGLVALTALEHRAILVSRDGRAARTYQAVGVEVEWVDS